MKDVKYGNILEKVVDGQPSIVIPIVDGELSKSGQHYKLNHTFNTFATLPSGVIVKAVILRPNPKYVDPGQAKLTA